MSDARLIPHGSRCEADVQLGDDLVHCDVPATNLVNDGKHDHYVCAKHYEWWMRDHQTTEVPGV